MTKQRLLLTTIAVVLLIALVVYVLLFVNRGATDSSSAQQFPDHASGTAFIDEAVVFDDLGRMAASTDLVVRGTVEAVSQGVRHTYSSGEAPDETDRLLSIQVADVVYSRAHGRSVAPGTEITVIEGWWSEGTGFELEGMPWSQPGDEGYFFLVADPLYASGTYTYVGSPGRALLEGQVAHVSGDPHGDGPWDDRLAGAPQPGQGGVTHSGEGPRERIEQLIAAAASRASRGESKPMPQPRISYPD